MSLTCSGHHWVPSFAWLGYQFDAMTSYTALDYRKAREMVITESLTAVTETVHSLFTSIQLERAVKRRHSTRTRLPIFAARAQILQSNSCQYVNGPSMCVRLCCMLCWSLRAPSSSSFMLTAATQIFSLILPYLRMI